MTARAWTLAALLTLAGHGAGAQVPTPLNLFGTVARLDADSITVQPDSGGPVERYVLAPDLLVIRATVATLADIRPGDFVASAAVRGTDGKLHSTELRIFPAAMRGLGEGQRPMNDAREQTMTNATVTGAAVAGGSNHLTVSFPGGQSELILGPGVPVTRLMVVGRDALTEGAAVRLQGTQTGSGGTATRITLQPPNQP